MPAFAALTTDDEREQKAQTRRPGTFGVVVTPDSFSDLPEYADAAVSRSSQAQTNNFESRTLSLHKPLMRSRTDPNVVVLERFEDAPTSTPGSFSVPASSRRPSLPANIQYLTISTSSPHPGAMLPPSPLTQVMRADGHLLSHFRHYVLPRLVQIQSDRATNVLTSSPIADAFEIEASRFPPLHHAICAISALNLSYMGRSTMVEATTHYHQALSLQTSGSNPDDLLSDGTLLRHFLLFIYDICIPMPNEEGGADMWTIHLSHLQQIMTLRHERLGREPHAYILWSICELDTYACLLGSRTCEFVRTILQQNMLPPLNQQIPYSAVSVSGTYMANEMSLFPAILGLNQSILLQVAKMAQMAQSFRQEASQRYPVSPGTYAKWQANVTQLQTELNSFWAHMYPEFLVSRMSLKSFTREEQRNAGPSILRLGANCG